MSEEKDNMKLWEQVCVTDPAITKHVEQRGGFTAIDAQAQIKRATELWGSYGSKWGVRDCEYSFLRGKDGEDVKLQALFWYPDGTFDIATDMKYKAGNDTCKKLLTDLTTKALSKLGFNSDVFEGKFDDNKYVAGLKNGKEELYISIGVAAQIGALLEETNSDPTKFLLYLKNTYGIADVGQLKVSQGKAVMATLNSKLDKQNAANN